MLELISFDLCPYVERNRIVLLEKGLPFAQRVVDLANKPDWFLRLSPRGKVPVLLVDGAPLFESSVINEFLDEYAPAPPLLPAGPVPRARARAWIAFASDAVLSSLARLWFGPPTGAGAARADVDAALAQLEAHLAGRPGGPFFLGADFSLVDAALAPVFTRLAASEALGHAPLLAGLPHLTAYAEALLARPSVQQARTEDLTGKLVAYVEGLRARA